MLRPGFQHLTGLRMISREHRANIQWSIVNGLLFHTTQPTSRSIVKAIA